MATKEQIYTSQMIELGIYEKAFDPEIRMLARLERELTRAQKEWSRTAIGGGAPSFTEPIYPTIQRLRQEILQHREALGLTPKALRKLRGQPAEGPSQQEQITAKLDLIAQRVSEYDAAADPGFGDKLDDLQGYLSNPEGYVSNKAPEPTAAEGGALGRALRRSGSADKPGRDPDPQAGAAYEPLPDAHDAIRISDRIDAELAHAVAEDMG